LTPPPHSLSLPFLRSSFPLFSFASLLVIYKSWKTAKDGIQRKRERKRGRTEAAGASERERESKQRIFVLDNLFTRFSAFSFPPVVLSPLLF
jgi:hypothetical protein